MKQKKYFIEGIEFQGGKIVGKTITVYSCETFIIQIKDFNKRQFELLRGNKHGAKKILEFALSYDNKGLKFDKTKEIQLV